MNNLLKKLLSIFLVTFVFLTCCYAAKGGKSGGGTTSGTLSTKANDDTATMTVPEQSSVTIDVLANDVGSDLSITNVSKPKKGSAWSNGSSVTYQPNWGYIGTDSFKYYVKQPGDKKSQTATVSITVNGPPAPVAGTFSATTDVRTQVSINVIGDNPSSVSVDSSYRMRPSDGSAWTSGSSVVYSPDYNFVGGEDSFNYQLTDIYGRSAVGTINVTVVGPAEPVAETYNVTTDVRTNVTINVIGDNPSGVTVDSRYRMRPGNGSAWTSTTSVIYSPDYSFAGGEDSFNYQLVDTYGRTALGTINVTVVGPEAPVAVADTAETDPGVAVTIPVLSNDTPSGGFRIDYGVALKPRNGTAYWSGKNIVYQPKVGFINDTDTFSYGIIDSFNQTSTGTVSVVVGIPEPVTANDEVTLSAEEGSITVNVLDNDTPSDVDVNAIVKGPKNGTAQISPDKTSIIYTVNQGFTGDDSFTYNTVDSLGRVSNNSTVTIHVVNTPVANSDAETISDLNSVSISVLSNDTPVGDIEVKAIATVPSRGSAQISGDKQSIVYTPDSSFTEGTDSFTYTINLISDPTSVSQPATVTITSESSTAIEANNDSAVITENTANVVINVLDNDTPVGDIEINSVSDPVKGSVNIINNTILYTPDSSFTDGTDSFTYTINLISDPSSLSEPATVTVTMDNGSVGEGEITPAIINATDENALSDLTESGSLIELDESNATDTSILPAIYLLNYKHIYNAYSEYDPGNEDLSKISDLCDELYQKRLEIEEGDMEDTAAVLEDFNTKMGTLVNSLQSLEDIE